MLYWIQHLISWITRLYVPILATAFLGGILCLYLLTQSHSTVDAGIPVLVGLSVMIGFAVWCCASSTDRINRWRNWLLTGIICTAGSVLLALAWFGLGVKYDLRYQWGVVYIVASLFITGSLVLFFSSHRHSWWSWGLLLAVLLCTVLGAGWSVKPLAAAIFTWTDWFFRGLLVWLARCLRLKSNLLAGQRSMPAFDQRELRQARERTLDCLHRRDGADGVVHCCSLGIF